MNLKEDDLVLCTVKRIEGTTVFLDIEGGMQGTMIFSEVSPGRIRNIREFVVPNKKIVCKVLKIKGDNPELSLRRVSTKEKEFVLDKHKKEQILFNILKPIVKDKTSEIIEKIREKYDLADFLDEARENSSLLEKFVPKANLDELKRIFVEKKEKEKEAKAEVKLVSSSESGLYDIQKALSFPKGEADIRYLGSSKFMITVKAKDYKIANASIERILESIKASAKKHNIKVEYKEK